MSRNLPWWSAFPISAGLAIMGVFAPTVLPDGWERLFFYGGAVALLIGVGAAAWHFGLGDWLNRNIMWRFGSSPPFGCTSADPLKSGLYVAEATIASNNLEAEHWLEVAFRIFNATSHHLAVTGVNGSIEMAVVVGSSVPDDQKYRLPTPSLLRERSDLSDIPPLAETIIVLQQHLAPHLVETVQGALEGDGLQFYFDDLSVLLESADGKKRATLPTKIASTLRVRNGVTSGRLIRLSMNAAVSASSPTFGPS